MLGVTGASLLGMPMSGILAQAGELGAKAEHVILFWCGGGMSHIDTWDPKPGRPTAGPFSPLETSADGVRISSLFPQLAKQMHHCALVRSIAGTNGDHGRASYELQTSQAQSPSVVHPGLGSIVVHEREPLGDLPALRQHQRQRAPARATSASAAKPTTSAAPASATPTSPSPAGIHQERGQKRIDILAKMNLKRSERLSSKEMRAAETAINSAVDLMKSPALSAFELAGVDPDTLAKYGNTDFGRGALLAKRLIKTGVRVVRINRGGFDNHSNIEDAMVNHGLAMDPALAALIEDLHDEGMLEKTMVMMVSEFGRTPRVNNNAGRDHHAKCFSAFFAGGGVEGGQVVGASDEDGVMPAERPVKTYDLPRHRLPRPRHRLQEGHGDPQRPADEADPRRG